MKQESSFWARRRAAVAAEDHADRAAQEAQALDEQQHAWDDTPDEDVLAALDLPAPETLGIGDDFTGFMARNVPERLRRRALRTLWRSNPVLACVDNLVDYGEDYTDAARVRPGMKTTYQVGKGLSRHLEEMARQATLREAPAVAEPAEENPAREDPVAAALQAPADPVCESGPVRDADPVSDAAPDTDADPETGVAPLPRRMKFTIEETT